MKFSIVIPTYNREKDLNKCLDSILNQTVLPSEVIIIDDGDLVSSFIEKIKHDFINLNVNLVYYKKNHKFESRGSSESRNKSLEFISNEIFFILDDDVVLETDFCKHISTIWGDKHDDKLIGVGGIIKNRRKKTPFEKYYNIFFGLNSKYSWDVNDAAFQVWNEDITQPTKGYYAHGGVCSYKLDKVRELKFSTFSGGRTALEDVDFCLRAKSKGYHFIIEPKAQLYHYPSKISREGQFLMGCKESANRKIIFNSLYKKPSFYLLTWFCWTNIGWALRQFLVGNLRKGIGMVKGMFS
jgi:GT2 family glycosyltransferase